MLHCPTTSRLGLAYLFAQCPGVQKYVLPVWHKAMPSQSLTVGHSRHGAQRETRRTRTPAVLVAASAGVEKFILPVWHKVMPPQSLTVGYSRHGTQRETHRTPAVLVGEGMESWTIGIQHCRSTIHGASALAQCSPDLSAFTHHIKLYSAACAGYIGLLRQPSPGTARYLITLLFAWDL